MRIMRRWLLVLTALVSALTLSVAPAGALPKEKTLQAPIGRVGDTLRVQFNDYIADVTVVSVTPSDIPPGWGNPPRPPRQEVWRANVVVQVIQAPTPATLAVSLSFRGVTPTGDSYEPRSTDAPDELRAALLNATPGTTVGGAVFWDCYRDLVSNVVLLDKKSGLHIAQWNL